MEQRCGTCSLWKAPHNKGQPVPDSWHGLCEWPAPDWLAGTRSRVRMAKEGTDCAAWKATPATRFEPCELCPRPAVCRDDAECGGFFEETPDPRDAEIARLRKALKVIGQLNLQSTLHGLAQIARAALKGTDDAGFVSAPINSDGRDYFMQNGELIVAPDPRDAEIARLREVLGNIRSLCIALDPVWALRIARNAMKGTDDAK